jgi:beta-galactosidase
MSTWFGGVDKIGEAYGYVLYRTTLKGGASGVSRLLQIKDVRDYAIVFVNGKRQGILDRMKKQDSLRITVPPGEGEATLDILVENMGRINYGPNLLKNTKGITQTVTLDQKELKGWKIYGFPFDPAGPAAATTAPATASPSETPAAAPSEMPVLKRATFQLDIPRDTYLDMRAWGKGCVWINGHNLGRYWEIGPQQTIYVPAEWLKQGANEIEVFELLKPGQNELKTVTKTILNILHQ